MRCLKLNKNGDQGRNRKLAQPPVNQCKGLKTLANAWMSEGDSAGRLPQMTGRDHTVYEMA
jgi:hypothetical protein